MELIKVKDYHEMSDMLVKIFADQIRNKPDSVLSFTTGKTPEEFLEKLADAVNACDDKAGIANSNEINAGLDISHCICLNLDEYVGKRDMPYSVYHFMDSHFYDRLSVKPREIHRLNGEAPDPDAEIKRYGEILARYVRDIQLLGLGTNGHIGANEPGTSFDSSLFVADSRVSTMKATKELFHLMDEQVPSQMYTMGFREILAARHIVLAASGSSKARAVKAAVEGEITEMVPASILRRHAHVTFIIDEEAGSLLEPGTF